MRPTEVAGRLNGVSTPLYGLSWTPATSDVAVARRVLEFVGVRRVLFSTYTSEVPEQCVTSVLDIPNFLTDVLGEGGIGEELSGPLRLLRRYCVSFLDRVGGSEPTDSDSARRHLFRDGAYRMMTTSSVKPSASSGAGWILYDGNVISFGDLRSDPLRGLVDGGVEEHETTEWANSSDTDVTHQFADLLRRTLVSDRRELQWHQARHHIHFRPGRNLRPVKAGRTKGRPGRTVSGREVAVRGP